MRTYVTILAGRTPEEARPVVSSHDPMVLHATLRAMRDQAMRETTAAGAERAAAAQSVEKAVRLFTDPEERAEP